MTAMTSTPAMAIRRAAPRSFVHVSDLPGSNEAARKAASRAVESGDLVRVRRGLYFKAPGATRYGPVKPRVEEIAREIFRGPHSGFGPAGYSAARGLGLTTQVPAKFEAAALRKADPPVPGVVLHVRSNPARAALNEQEIAVLEVLRSPEHFVDGGMTMLARKVSELAAAKAVRLRALGKAVAGETGPVKANHARLVTALSSVA
ncbi:DUF6088 family protein [Mycolicibacterium sp. XJ662]